MDSVQEIEKDTDIQTITESFPVSRVRKIVKLDQEIKKLTSEALHLISLSTNLFLESLTEASRSVAVQKKRKIIKLEHIKAAVHDHTPTSDFLLDCLMEGDECELVDKKRKRKIGDFKEKKLERGERRIDTFFSKE